MSLAANAARMVDTKGDAMTLARDGEVTVITLKGKRTTSGSTEAIGGSAVQQNFRVRISVAEIVVSAWSAKEPRRHDTLTVDGRAREVLDATAVKDGEAIALWEVEVVG